MRLLTYLTVVCLFLVGTTTLHAQTQYIGPAGGDWFTATNWNNGLPASGNDPLIGGGASVDIGSALTVDFTITNFGTITASADIVNDGAISNSGTLDLAGTASLTNNATLNNFDVLTLAGPATFVNETGATFTNGGNFTLATTLVNRGSVTNNGTIDAAAGTLVTEGNFDNAQTLTTESLTVASTSTFTNNFGSNLNITGGAAELLVDGNFNNLGTVSADGILTVNGTFSNSSSLTSTGVLTINTGGTLNNAGGTVNTQGGTQNFGTFINGFQLINSGSFNNFGQFNNNNLISNELGATFSNRPGAVLSMGFGSQILNTGTFLNEDALDSFGSILNDGTFTNTGNINSFSGSTIDNNADFTNGGTMSTNDQVMNDGTFTLNGTVNVNGGSVWSNNATFNISLSGRVNVVQDFQNNLGGTLTNNGQFSNQVRTRNDGNFINNAYLENIGDWTNGPTGVLTNNELLLQQFGNIMNEGSIVNNDNFINDDCSTVNNQGSIDNQSNFELHAIIFQQGNLSGNAINCQGCFVQNDPTSNAQSICQNGTFGANIDGEVKVYAPELIAFENFDSCNNIVYLANGEDRPVFACSDIGTVITGNVVLLTRLGDSLTCTADITPVDVLEPQFDFCPQDIVVFTPDPTVAVSWTEPTATDNCTPTTLNASHAPGDSFPVGITGVTYSATDDYGNVNNCQFRVDVRQTPAGGNCSGDIQNPVFSICPNDIVLTTSGSSAVAGWTPPSVSDDCYPLFLEANFVPGASFGIGTTTVIYTATDGNGNEATCEFNVTVNFDDPCLVDNVPPSFSGCPPNIYQPTNPVTGGAVAVWTEPGAFDLCGIASVTASNASGEIFPEGTTNVTYTANDNNGNVGTCNFVVTVGNDPCPGDQSPPFISNCPNDVSILTNGNSGVASWTPPTASSSCGPVTVNSNFQPGATFQLGVTQVDYQFSDLKGNTSTCTFLVIVQNDCDVDNLPPVISNCPADITVADTGGGSGTATWTEPTAIDNCQLTGFTSSFQPGASFPLGVTTVIYTASDLQGNVATCEINVTVVGAPGCTQNASPIEGSTGVDPASVTLSWITENDAEAYDVYLGTSNPPTTIAASDVAGTSTTVTGLQGNTTYFWYVVPKNIAGGATGCGSAATSFSTAGGGTGGDCNFEAIFVVGSTNLNTSDAFAKARLESLGFSVQVIDDNNTQTSDADGKGLIVISSTTNSGNVNTKYRDVEVPVICWEPYLYDDFKMTSTGSGSNYGSQNGVSQILIENAAHPLAAGLSGTVNIFNSGHQVAWGKPASTAIVVGSNPNSTSRKLLFAYDTGDQMVGSQIAPAPRIGIFLRNNTAHLMNANGLALFDAAVRWATGTAEPGTLCNDGNPNTIDDVILADGCTCEGTPICTGEVTGFSFNEVDNTPIFPLENGGSYSVSSLPAVYTIEALVTGTLESAQFYLTGPVNISNMENYVPWNLGGTGGSFALTPGDYTLTVTLYSEDNGAGVTCSQTTIGFTIEPDDPCANDSPSANVTVADASCSQSNGEIKFAFNDSPSQSTIEFSLDGGNTYPYSSPDDAGTTTVTGLASGTYDAWVRWGDGSCPVDLGTLTVGGNIFPPSAVCQDIALEQTVPGQSVQISGADVDGGSTAGCGTISSLNVTPNSFNTPGSYTVTLTVTNSFGLSANCNATVTVELAPQPEDCFNGIDDDGDGLVDCEDPDCGSLSGSISVRVSDKNDDAEEDVSDGKVDRGSSDLELVFEGNNEQVVGMRFRNIQVPQGATITNAYIEFEADETDSGTTNLTFFGEDTDDADKFESQEYNISSRPKTSASVDWNNVPAWNTVSEKHQTPDLSAIVQEIVGRGGWGSGNDLVILVEGSGERTAESYNGESQNAPLLVVEFAECGEVCDNVTAAGSIEKNCQDGFVTLDNVTLPSGGTGDLEYLWISGTVDCDPVNMSPVGGSGSTPSLVVGGVSETTYFIRCARRSGCTEWDGESNCIIVEPTDCQAVCNPDVLFVVGNVALNSGDSWVKNRLEILGYTVELVDQYSATAAQAGGKGMVVISSTVNSGNIGNTFTNVSVPVVTWESWLLDDLKMTGTSNGSDYGSTGGVYQLTIQDPTHPLAAGLSGTVQVYTNTSNMRWGYVPETSGALRIAEVAGHNGDYGILAYDDGAVLADGSAAPARRLSLWLDNTQATLLTADGVALFDAAMNWASGCENLGERSALLGFSATANGFDVDFAWVSNTADLDDDFAIERSADGKNWEPLLTVEAKPSNDEFQTYRSMDTEPLAGENFYRLISYRANGSVEESAVEQVFFADLEAYAVFPNPARGQIFVDLSKRSGQEVLIRLFDAKGVTVQQWNVIANDDPMPLELNVKQSGQYLLWMYVEDHRPVTRRVILERE